MANQFNTIRSQVLLLFQEKEFQKVLDVLGADLPSCYEDYLYRGMCLSRLGQHEAALKMLSTGLELFPSQPELLAERAVIYLHLGKKALSILDLDLAVEVEPNNPYRYASRGFIREKLGDAEGAQADYERALELDPGDAITHNNLGLILERKGRPQLAKKHFDVADSLQQSEGGEMWKRDNQVVSTDDQHVEAAQPELQNTSWWKEMWKPFVDASERKAFWRWITKSSSGN